MVGSPPQFYNLTNSFCQQDGKRVWETAKGDKLRVREKKERHGLVLLQIVQNGRRVLGQVRKDQNKSFEIMASICDKLADGSLQEDDVLAERDRQVAFSSDASGSAGKASKAGKAGEAGKAPGGQAAGSTKAKAKAASKSGGGKKPGKSAAGHAGLPSNASLEGRASMSLFGDELPPIFGGLLH